LSATLQLYRAGLAWQRVPLLRALRASEEQLKLRARQFLNRLRRRLTAEHPLQLSVRRGYSLMGGGSAPEHPLPTALIAIKSKKASASIMEANLRAADPPVIARIENDELALDLRTVLPRDEAPLLRAVVALANCQ
jgi:L-seryl-tRNA(Ser) seleniumtransferase